MQEETVTDKIEEVVKEDIWGSIRKFLDWGLHIGEGENEVHITVGLILLILLAFIATNFILRFVRRFSTRKMDETDAQKFKSVFNFIRYLVYIAVIFAVLNLAGVNVTPVIAAAAALLLGVGLALQQLFQDVIGGILILIDKSLLVGDIVEVDGKVSRVIEINIRTTRAITRMDKVIIIPNHKFINDTLYNHTQNNRIIKESVIVGVAYGSDTQKVKDLMLQSATEHPSVLEQPKPFVFFQDFGDSALIFQVFYSLNNSFASPGVASEIRFKIDRLFRENGITIPFPQRDLHIISDRTKQQ